MSNKNVKNVSTTMNPSPPLTNLTPLTKNVGSAKSRLKTSPERAVKQSSSRKATNSGSNPKVSPDLISKKTRINLKLSPDEAVKSGARLKPSPLFNLKQRSCLQSDAFTKQLNPSPDLDATRRATKRQIAFDDAKLKTFEKMVDTATRKFERFDVVVRKQCNSNERWICVGKKDFDLCPPVSVVPQQSARLLFSENGVCKFEVLGKVIFTSENPDVDQWLKIFNNHIVYLHPEWTFCIGIAAEHFSQNNLEIEETTFERNTVPYETYRSKNCQMWTQSRRMRDQRCSECSLGIRRLREKMQSKLENMSSRTNVDSKVNLRHLTSEEKEKRRRNQQKRASLLLRELNEMKKTLKEDQEVSLATEQSIELKKIVESINNQFSSVLEEIFEESGTANGSSFAKTLRETWAHDQVQNTSGKKGNRWSLVTYRLALAVFVRSPAAYRALAAFPMLQLPSVRQLQRVTSANFPGGPGPNNEILAQQAELYAEKQKSAKIPGKQAGILVFDEVKVVSKVYWNSKSQEIYGLASSGADFSSLHDVYEQLKPDEKKLPAEYVLQFVWRDLTSNYDVIGPYFMSSKTADSDFLLSCLMSAIRAFSEYGFKIEGVVFDGASSNLTLMKMLCKRHKGPFKVGVVNEDASDPFHVPTRFPHPCDPSTWIHCIPCPTHMLKNYVNALHSSRIGGGRLLTLNLHSSAFGWAVIEKMWQREVERKKTGDQRVKDLTRSDIVRDAWTKLNVAPAKKMQQDPVIAELEEYAAADSTPPAERAVVRDCATYLSAGRNLFECGFLSHNKISIKEELPLRHIGQGFVFLCEWYTQIATDEKFCPTSDKRFLAWQTFDLLRFSIYGFCGLTAQFLKKYSDHYIVPHRVNGSVCESFFSQVRQRTGSAPLTGPNYASAVSRILASNTVELHQGKRKQDDNYRNEKLCLKRVKK